MKNKSVDLNRRDKHYKSPKQLRIKTFFNNSDSVSNQKINEKTKCLICKSQDKKLSHICEIHNFCSDCINTDKFPHNVYRSTNNCDNCIACIENCSAEVIKQEASILQSSISIPSNFKPNLLPKSEKDLKSSIQSERSIPKEYNLQQGFFARLRRCKLCKKREKEYIMICKKHKLCLKCSHYHLESNTLPKRKIKCLNCCEYFRNSIADKNQCFKNGEMNDKEEVKTNLYQKIDYFNEEECEEWKQLGMLAEKSLPSKKSLDSKIEEGKGIPAEESSTLKKFSAFTKQEVENQAFMYQTINSLELICGKCKSNNDRMFGFLCNHNVCLSCISDSGFREILEYERSKLHLNSEKFSYHCPQCNSTIDIPTRMIFNQLTINHQYQLYSITENYFETKIKPNLAFYDGVD